MWDHLHRKLSWESGKVRTLVLGKWLMCAASKQVHCDSRAASARWLIITARAAISGEAWPPSFTLGTPRSSRAKLPLSVSPATKAGNCQFQDGMPCLMILMRDLGLKVWEKEAAGVVVVLERWYTADVERIVDEWMVEQRLDVLSGEQ